MNTVKDENTTLQKFSKLLKDGIEHLSTVPVALPFKFGKSRSVSQRMRDIREFSYDQHIAMMAEGKETFEEATDFDIDDDPYSDIETDEEYAYAQAASRGLVLSPTADRLRELDQKYGKAVLQTQIPAEPKVQPKDEPSS